MISYVSYAIPTVFPTEKACNFKDLGVKIPKVGNFCSHRAAFRKSMVSFLNSI